MCVERLSRRAPFLQVDKWLNYQPRLLVSPACHFSNNLVHFSRIKGRGKSNVFTLVRSLSIEHRSGIFFIEFQ